MSYSLIVPIAANKEAYKEQLPPVFAFDKEGVMLCVKSILGLNHKDFDNIYFTILKEHDQRYCLQELLNLQFRRLGIKNAKVFVLESSTRSQPETVYETIKCNSIDGSVFVKDADSFFRCNVGNQNGVTIFPLENLESVNPQHKSYVAVDDMFYITNVIERKIISHYFNAGGYCFGSASLFCDYYNRYKGKNGLCLSHIIYSMLLDKAIFRPIMVTDYIDFEYEFR